MFLFKSCLFHSQNLTHYSLTLRFIFSTSMSLQCKFPVVTKKGICLTIMSILNLWSFPLISWCIHLIQEWCCKGKLEAVTLRGWRVNIYTVVCCYWKKKCGMLHVERLFLHLMTAALIMMMMMLVMTSMIMSWKTGMLNNNVLNELQFCFCVVMNITASLSCFSSVPFLKSYLFNPSHPNISRHILHTVL